MTRAEIEKEYADDARNAVGTVMSTPAGRRFVTMILELSLWDSNPYAQEHGAISYNVGVQAVGKDVHSMVDRLQPEQTRKMHEEWRERRDLLESNGE